ncbi:DUF808 domain-containing protein [Endozoicomonas sp. OPT23]|uniref:DUF808 domain-containing protein n=1 Tax=Endozoicomonas sp. OPT23 TaxID=2072845 RepID=UPI00129B44E0|nr:DUF808 domain-containing protein [Endozoicomonas sp. OPT23]MRI33751.1 DUF808 domain-containing protein [Endozoicomonas sp. OPT23]
MASANLLALIDDIATMLDDVAVMSKVAAKKTAGVLGDDLALNAEQVSGVKADRELPVVWAVAKGSSLNKLILVPAALLISAFLPWAINVLLMLGGAYLCFEGFEKISHKFLHSDDASGAASNTPGLSSETTEMLEQKKIRGAIRTDFILSAEIIVIVLGSVQESELLTRISVLSGLAVLFTVGVYGLVAAIVKLDDAGLYLLNKSGGTVTQSLGRGLLLFAPFLMKTLSVVGTIAMFLVGGGILMHGIPGIESYLQQMTTNPLIQTILPTLASGFIGLIAGACLLSGWLLGQKIKG